MNYRKLALLEKQLLDLDKRIERLRASIAFVGGRVGGSGNPARLARLNRQRERQLDRHIDTSVELSRLLVERRYVQEQINALVARPKRQKRRGCRQRRVVGQLRRRGDD